MRRITYTPDPAPAVLAAVAALYPATTPAAAVAAASAAALAGTYAPPAGSPAYAPVGSRAAGYAVKVATASAAALGRTLTGASYALNGLTYYALTGPGNYYVTALSGGGVAYAVNVPALPATYYPAPVYPVGYPYAVTATGAAARPYYPAPAPL